MSAHRAWWPPAPITNSIRTPCPPISLPPPPSSAVSSFETIPPQHLWPHHALPGNSSPNLTRITTGKNTISFENASVPFPPPPYQEPSPPSTAEKHLSKEIYPIRPYYVGIFLSGPSKHRLLDRYPPHHARIYADHVTLKYFGYNGSIATDVAECLERFPLGATVAIGIVGSAADDRCQALEVNVPSWVPYTNTSVPPHVTVSVVESVEAREAGIIIKERKAQGEIEPVHGLRVLHGIAGVCLTDRTVIYSEKELTETINNNTLGSDGDRSKEEFLPPLPSNRLLAPLKKTETENISRTHEYMTTSIDLVSLLHQCFPALPPPVPLPPPLPAPPLPAAADKTLGSTSSSKKSTNFIRQLTSKSSSRPSSANSTTTNNKNNKRMTSQGGPSMNRASVSSISAVEGSAVVPIARRAAWYKTSKVQVRETIITSATCDVILETATTAAGISASTSFPSPSSNAAVHQHQPHDQQDAAFQLDLEAAENERAIMNAHHTAYKSALSTSKRAKSTGDHASARAHTLAAHRHASAFLAARQRSSAAAFHAHNASINNIFKIDLHGMHVKEAVAVLKRYIEGLSALQHPGGVLLKIVTGFGRHSQVPGRAKVLPAVVQYLAEVGVLFDVEEENPGMVRVLLEPHLCE